MRLGSMLFVLDQHFEGGQGLKQVGPECDEVRNLANNVEKTARRSGRCRGVGSDVISDVIS